MLNGLFIVQFKMQPLIHRLGINNRYNLINKLHKIEFFPGNGHFARFYFGHIQYIIDKGEQITGGGVNFAEAVLYSGRILFFQLADSGHADNGVHRCPDIMAHTGKEIRFCLIGRPCRRQRIPQQLLLTGFFGSLCIQQFNQFNSKKILPYRIVHINQLYRDPVILSVYPFCLNLHI